MRAVGDDNAALEPKRKEITRLLRLLKIYRTREQKLIGEINGVSPVEEIEGA